MIDVRNRELAEGAKIDDFVVSNKLVSLMLAQASENEHLEEIFKDLLDEEGSEICLRPASDYHRPAYCMTRKIRCCCSGFGSASA